MQADRLKLFSNTDGKKLFKFFGILKSTGFIVPIFFIYLESHLRVSLQEVLLISGLYYCLPFILEVPLGWLADKIGNKRIITTGLISQVLSCLFAIMNWSDLSYHLYLLFILVAQCCYSGAETALIRSQFKEGENFEFKMFMQRYQSDFYKYTIVFLIVGALSYKIYFLLPFFLQMISFVASGLALWPIKEKRNSEKNEGLKPQILANLNTASRSISFVFKDKIFLALTLISIVFGSAIQINHKTIQSQLVQASGIDLAFALGIIYSIGNLISANGASTFNVVTRKYKSLKIEIFLLYVVMAMAYLLLSLKSFALNILGFCVLNFFKGAYRPIVNSELANRIPTKRNIALILSISALFTSVGISLSHIVLSEIFLEVWRGNTLFLYAATTAMMLSFILLLLKNNWKVFVSKSLLTNKSNFLCHTEGKIFFEQAYGPFDKDIEGHLKGIKMATDQKVYNSPSYYLSIDEKNIALSGAYIDGSRLSDVLDNDKIIKFCNKILQSRKEVEVAFKAKLPVLSDVLSKKSLDILGRYDHQKSSTCIHGDMHPDNIIINSSEEVYLVDWDQCGTGPFWYDLITLASHPEINLPKREQLMLFKRYLGDINMDELNTVMADFTQFKSKQIKSFSQADPNFLTLAKKYEKIHATYC